MNKRDTKIGHRAIVIDYTGKEPAQQTITAMLQYLAGQDVIADGSNPTVSTLNSNDIANAIIKAVRNVEDEDTNPVMHAITYIKALASFIDNHKFANNLVQRILYELANGDNRMHNAMKIIVENRQSESALLSRYSFTEQKLNIIESLYNSLY